MDLHINIVCISPQKLKSSAFEESGQMKQGW